MNPILLVHLFASRLLVRSFFVAVLLGSMVSGLNSCATARGFGQDVETTGEKIEDAATR